MLRILVPFTYPANSYLSSGLTGSSKAIFSKSFPSSSPYSVQPHLLCILSHSQFALGMIWLATVRLDGAVSFSWIHRVFPIPCFAQPWLAESTYSFNKHQVHREYQVLFYTEQKRLHSCSLESLHKAQLKTHNGGKTHNEKG